MAKSRDVMEQAQVEMQKTDLLARKQRALRLNNYWWKVITAFLVIYTALPILAPILMKVGATGPASVIYNMYYPMCHQAAFRSTFLFGEHTVYPREVSTAKGQTFEEYAVQSDDFVEIYTRRRKEQLRNSGLTQPAANYVFNPADLEDFDDVLLRASKEFKGDERMGYKIALCERDIAIYLSLTATALIFPLIKRWIRPVPLWLYIWLGIVPIGLDGFSQLFGYPPFSNYELFQFLEVRETTPFFRYLTGSLFGLMNGWLAFPYLHRGAQDNVRRLEDAIRDLEAQTHRGRKNLSKAK